MSRHLSIKEIVCCWCGDTCRHDYGYPFIKKTLDAHEGHDYPYYGQRFYCVCGKALTWSSVISIGPHSESLSPEQLKKHLALIEAGAELQFIVEP